MGIALETVLADYLGKAVSIKLTSGAAFNGYIIGVRLPVRELVMLYYVPLQHIDKYIKNGNARWVDLLPYSMLKSITLLSQDIEKEMALAAFIQSKDITS